jgi:signal transduction histidine kinase
VTDRAEPGTEPRWSGRLGLRRLYLQVYLTIVGSLILVVLASGILARFIAVTPPFDQRFENMGRLIAEMVPPAGAAKEAQQRTVDRLALRLDIDMALFDATGRRIATAGSPVPLPDRRGVGGWRLGLKGPVLSIPLPDGRWLVARVPTAQHPHPLALIALLGAIALAVALGTLPVARRLTRRIERLQRGVESLGAGDLAARVKVEGRDEVAQLAQSFNRAAARIESLISAHKMLLANASHELRTPLTRIRVGLELAEANPERKAVIERDIAELDQLIDEILLVSRLDAIGELDVHEDVDLTALAAEECARFKDCRCEGKSVAVNGDPALLRRMVRNLVENAQRHGTPPIEVAVGVQEGDAVLSVSDHGPAIPQGERERLFLPSYRARGTASPSGTGLGLALVRQIARRHGGDVTYRAERGNAFVVTIPSIGAPSIAQG